MRLLLGNLPNDYAGVLRHPDGRGPSLGAQSGQQGSGAGLVVFILIPERLDQVRFFPWDDDPAEDNGPDAWKREQEPAAGEQPEGEKLQQSEGIERMPDPAVRAMGDQLVGALGQDGLRDVVADAHEHPPEGGYAGDRQDCRPPTEP